MQHTLLRLDRPSYPPNMNPIEIVWSIWKAHLRAEMRDANRLTHRQEQDIKVAQEAQEGLPQGRNIYSASGLKPGSQKQFMTFNSIINLVQRERRVSFFAQCSTAYPVMNRFSPLRLGSWWC